MKLSIVEESGLYLVRDEDSNMWLARDFWTQDKRSAKRHGNRELASQSVKRYEALWEEMMSRREKGAKVIRLMHGEKGVDEMNS